MGYPTDLTAEEFSEISILLPERSRMGRPARDARLIVNAIFYVVKTGCQWRFYQRISLPGRQYMAILENGITQGSGFRCMNDWGISCVENLGKIRMPA